MGTRLMKKMVLRPLGHKLAYIRYGSVQGLPTWLILPRQCSGNKKLVQSIYETHSLTIANEIVDEIKRSGINSKGTQKPNLTHSEKH